MISQEVRQAFIAHYHNMRSGMDPREAQRILHENPHFQEYDKELEKQALGSLQNSV